MDKPGTLVVEVPFRPYSNEWIDDCRGMVTEAVYEVLHRRAKRRRELMQLAVEEELRQLQSGMKARGQRKG